MSKEAGHRVVQARIPRTNFLSAAYLVTLMDQSDVLPEVRVPLTTHRTGCPLLLVNIGQVPLQVCLEVTTVATLCTLVLLQLKQGSFGSSSHCHQ